MRENPIENTDCSDTTLESAGYYCLSERSKRKYCEKLVDKVLEEHPDLSREDIMMRLGYVCEEAPPRFGKGKKSRYVQKSAESDFDRRKMLYAETICRQVLIENPHFSRSKVKAAVRNLLRIVPEVDASEEHISDINSRQSSSPLSLAVELSQSDCKAHDSVFDLIMEEVLGTKDVCGSISKQKSIGEDPCEEMQYRMTLNSAVEEVQQKRAEEKAVSDAERAKKLNSYLADICRNLDTSGVTSKTESKSSKKTFADRNPCSVGCDDWTGGDSGARPASYAASYAARSYRGANKSYPSPCKDYLKPGYRSGNFEQSAASYAAGNTYWESNPCNVGCDAWGRKISAGDFKFSVPPRLHLLPKGQYDPTYMTPNIKSPNLATYGSWKEPTSCCEDGGSNFQKPPVRSQYRTQDAGKCSFADQNPCRIWDPFCTGRNAYTSPAVNYQQRNRYTMSPTYLYPNQRPYAAPGVRYSGINRYC